MASVWVSWFRGGRWRPALRDGWRLALITLALATIPAQAGVDRRKTVCTITINSDDEKLAFERHLPSSRFRFVELVQPGRADWLQAACRSGVRCDVMIVSGHFDGGDQFFADGDGPQEALTVSELERASCSAPCAGLFEHLQEVHLYGCNTLAPWRFSSVDDVRSAVRQRATRGNVPRQDPRLSTVYGESSRERMRQIFDRVPVIYGFDDTAPLGPQAAQALERALRSGGAAAVGRGRPNAALLAQLAPQGMVSVTGVSEQELRARWDMCEFADPRSTPSDIAHYLHRLLRRDVAEVARHLDRIQRTITWLVERPGYSVALAAALRDLAEDIPSRQRLLDAARAAAGTDDRVRLLRLARDLGWLTPAGHRQELARLLGEVAMRPQVGLDEIHLACTLNNSGELDGVLGRGAADAAADAPGTLAHAALRACVGAGASRQRTLAALASDDEHEVQIAAAYLRHRPVVDAAELRRLAAAVAAMPAVHTQVLALDALARMDPNDGDVVQRLAALYAQTASWQVQVAVAGALMHADQHVLPRDPWLDTLRERRLPAPEGRNKIDALIALIARFAAQ